MEIEEPTTVTCKVLAMEESSYRYKACANCQTAVPDHSPRGSCTKKRCRTRRYGYIRLFRLVFTIAVEDKVFDAVCFDRNAQIIFGCSVEEFRDFELLHPSAVKGAHSALVGEMFQTTLCKATRTNDAKHLRMTKVVPLRPYFKPVIQTLKEQV